MFCTQFKIALVLLLAAVSHVKGQSNRPNIIYILADDLGYNDISHYGQKRFKTPNIDRLAKEGMTFTQHYSGAPVCAPSRSSLMTGLHSGHTFIRGNKEVQPEGQWPLPSDAFTIPRMLKSAGYSTGVFGKWGLGYPGSQGAPENQAVDKFFGYNCQRLAHNYYPEYLWDNTNKVVLHGNSGVSKNEYAPALIHNKALEFIENHKDRLFFLFYAMVTPHAELTAPDAYMAKYRGRFLPEKPYDGVDPGEPNFRRGPYGSQAEPRAAFAAMIDVMDEQVGSIVAKVQQLGLDSNTLIIFTSDNGPHVEGGADPDYFDSNGILRGYKRDVYEGGIRVPMIARWKSVIEPNSESSHVSAFWDVLPTFAELVNANIQGNVDGISFLPTLTNKTKEQRKHNYLYWEFHEQRGRRALRHEDWKLVQYGTESNPPGPLELYDLKEDPSEAYNIALRYPEKVRQLNEIMQAARKPAPDFPFGTEKKK